MSQSDTLRDAILAWAEQDPEPAHKELAVKLVETMLVDEGSLSRAHELFASRLRFGTAGIRGPMRAGPNGMNRLVIAQTTAGIAEFLLERGQKMDHASLQVVIGFDGRHHSKTFARDAAEVFCGYGITVALLPRVLPTPVLAYAVR